MLGEAAISILAIKIIQFVCFEKLINTIEMFSNRYGIGLIEHIFKIWMYLNLYWNMCQHLSIELLKLHCWWKTLAQEVLNCQHLSIIQIYWNVISILIGLFHAHEFQWNNRCKIECTGKFVNWELVSCSEVILKCILHSNKPRVPMSIELN